MARCSSCEGEGSERCIECCGSGETEDEWGGPQECEICEGYGRVKCSDCNGMGDGAMAKDKPFWWPQPVNDEWRARIRADYPEETQDMSDGEIDEEYAEGWCYATTWDHLGDAQEEYGKLADAFLKLVDETGKKPEDFVD